MQENLQRNSTKIIEENSRLKVEIQEVFQNYQKTLQEKENSLIFLEKSYKNQVEALQLEVILNFFIFEIFCLEK